MKGFITLTEKVVESREREQIRGGSLVHLMVSLALPLVAATPPFKKETKANWQKKKCAVNCGLFVTVTRVREMFVSPLLSLLL
ncbi:hypothetical protein VNO77_43764 [Canavalia gladiata]|uniref:Uncharacterized protein n=1 Tax=Canavalia gladiata TaxID=3824 RepID=A0AAN9PQ62_CANGL